MPSERIQRRIDQLLDEADQAFAKQDWPAVQDLAKQVLALDRANADAQSFADAAVEMLDSGRNSPLPRGEGQGEGTAERQHHPEPLAAGASATPPLPTSFDSGRYTVKKFLGEGGKKKVYLAHDKMLDRDVAFALIKTEGLDAIGRERVSREAQAMGRLGSHPYIVTVFDP